ncbi:hypothetical protein DFR40_1033 [Azonexus fungiphilus]|uniref:Alpha/beta hydrolase n=1 Tax=Azonexus fungiphilus TaxID=146940 RepID=A0A495WJT0_9RHOO|nr:alpha/beta hydrolase [Azonexus fungiphilus]RKT60883.1 hypothetical protein DFR40_1033 [Azonexus fungiphilus]
MKPWLALLPLCLAACSSLPTPAERRQLAETLAAQHAWQALDIAGERLTLRAWLPAKAAAADELTIYIEGDGLAWLSSSQPSADPTPREPLALRLALAQPAGNAAYLARPCQYVSSPGCRQADWTEGRFAADLVAATNLAVDRLKQRFSARRLTLVGYSGGAAIAALVAARRDDVGRLVSVAGNLDHRAWTTLQRISPLAGSLNPVDAAGRLAAIPQRHFVGGKDRIVPAAVAESYVRSGAAKPASITVIEDFDHHCCWAARWPELWRMR